MKLFKRLHTWWHNRKLVPVYGWETGPNKRPVPVVLRYVSPSSLAPLVKTDRLGEGETRPTEIVPHGLTTEEHKARGRAHTRAWLVESSPDMCTFL
jgi:hypothetical protein